MDCQEDYYNHLSQKSNQHIQIIKHIMTAIALSRFASSKAAIMAASRPQARYLSAQGTVAVERLRGVLEEYRVQK